MLRGWVLRVGRGVNLKQAEDPEACAEPQVPDDRRPQGEFVSRYVPEP